MRMMTALFLPFLITTMLIELTPGPNMAWLALTSATQGKRSGFAAVAGIATGLAILALASAMGLAALAAQSPFTFSFLRYAGVAYLLWLAWQTWVEEKEVGANHIDATAMAAWFRHGLLLNLLNPKAAVFFCHGPASLYRNECTDCSANCAAVGMLCCHCHSRAPRHRCISGAGAWMDDCGQPPEPSAPYICCSIGDGRNLVLGEHCLTLFSRRCRCAQEPSDSAT